MHQGTTGQGSHLLNSTLSNVRGMSVKDITDTIPRFSGENIGVNEFASGCRVAIKLVAPELEKDFLKFTTLRLQGEALRSIEGQEFDR